MRVGFLAIGVFLLIAGSCLDEARPCKSSAECATGEICGGVGAGPDYCLKDCTESDDCPLGATCESVTNADCPVCREVTKACLVNRPDLLR